MKRAALALVALALLSSAPGCSGADEPILVAGQKVDALTIDRDPLALLPSGAVLVGYVDAASLFQSSLGNDVARTITSILPLGPESNFEPKRDVTRVFGGVYAMQGADFAAVVQGNFDPDAIRRAADARAITIAGAPLVKIRYAESDLYTAGNIGFVVLTTHTVLTGNETGIRRALDRLRFSKLERSIPSWIVDLMNTKNASIAVGGDLSGQGTTDAASKAMPFLQGVKTVRAVGNFQSPGVNVAGALTYPDAQSAQNASASLQKFQQITSIVSFFTSLGGVTLPQVASQPNGSDVGFTTSIQEGTVRALLGWLGQAAKQK
jgi:hypothetical protein